MAYHKCIDEKINMQLERGAKYVIIDLCNISRENETILRTGQKIEIVTEGLNKKGIKKENRLKSFLTHNYCPFCGKSYEDINKEESK